MSVTVDDDFREFVAARWPELESVALLVLLDADRARAVTADALAGMNRRWHDTVDAGRPGEQARRAVLRGAVAAAPAAHPNPNPGTNSTNWSDLPRTTAGTNSTNWSNLPRTTVGTEVTNWSNLPRAADGTPDEDTVVSALVDAIGSAPALERAVLAARELWGCEPDEVAALLDRDPVGVGEHAASVDARLAAAHDAARAADGLDPSPWTRERDVSAAVERILHGVSDPPDPAALVADRAGGLRRRTLLAGGLAAAAIAGVGTVLVRRASTTPAPSARPSVAPLARDDPRWGTVSLWSARGPLAGDPAVASLLARSGDARDRVLWAGDVGTQRVVLALTYTSHVGQQDGVDQEPSDSAISFSEPFVRAYQGPRGIDPTRLTVTPLSTSGTLGTTDVAAVTLPDGEEGAPQSLLVVLARPTLSTASVSTVARPLPDGTVERTWSALPLADGVSATTLDTALPLATRLRVGSWEGWPDSFTESYRVVAEGPRPSTSPQWAENLVAALTGIEPARLTSSVFVDEEVPRGLLDWPPPPDAEPARIVSLLTTTPDGAVLRTTAYVDEDSSWVLEPTHLFPTGAERDPIVVWGSDEREGVARFLVAAPGADRVQLISTSPDGYPVSKVVRTGGRDAVVVPVVNGGSAGEYRVIIRDASGRVSFDGVPKPGRSVVDT